jgi:hypothetical protein
MVVEKSPFQFEQADLAGSADPFNLRTEFIAKVMKAKFTEEARTGMAMEIVCETTEDMRFVARIVPAGRA